MPAFALLCASVAFGAFALTQTESRGLFLLIAGGNLVSGLALWFSKQSDGQSDDVGQDRGD